MLHFPWENNGKHIGRREMTRDDQSVTSGPHHSPRDDVNRRDVDVTSLSKSRGHATPADPPHVKTDEHLGISPTNNRIQ
jgi:hypothetical protein